jgi:hypothetical protein
VNGGAGWMAGKHGQTGNVPYWQQQQIRKEITTRLRSACGTMACCPRSAGEPSLPTTWS